MDTTLTDFTGVQHTTAFSCAEGLICMPVDELRKQEQEDVKQAEALVNRALFKTRIFTVKATVEKWQGNTRLKLSMLRSDPVDYIAETKVRREMKSVIWNGVLCRV